MKANDRQVGGRHYKKSSGCQPWDWITANFGPGFLIGNAIKYVIRWQDKGGIEDLYKAGHYCQKLAEEAEKSLWEPGNLEREPLRTLLEANDVNAYEGRIIMRIVEWETHKDFETACDMITVLINRSQAE